MNRLGIESLNAGAPDIKYTGTEGPQDPRMASAYLGDKYMGMQDLVDEFKQRHGYDPMHDIDQWKKFLDMKRQDPEARVQDRDTRTAGPRGTYTQRRRTQMAGGGIMGSNAGSMLVAPTSDGSRPGYFGLSDAWDWAKEKAVPFIADKAMDLGGDWIKDKLGMGDPQPMPQGSPGQINPYTPPYFPESTVAGPMNYLQPPKSTVAGPMDYLQPSVTDDLPWDFLERTGITDSEKAAQVLAQGEGGQWDPSVGNPFVSIPKEDPSVLKKIGQTLWPGGEPGYFNLWGGGEPQLDKDGNPIREPSWKTPMAIGAAAGEYQRQYLKDQPKFGEDTTGIKCRICRRSRRRKDWVCRWK